MSSGTTLTARWIEDGFFHPPSEVAKELVDAKGFLRIPLAGVQRSLQFARVAVSRSDKTESEVVLVLGLGGIRVEQEVLSFSAARFPGARLAVLQSTAEGQVVTRSQGEPVTPEEAAGIAVLQYRNAWDESERIAIVDGERKIEVSVEYSPELYTLRVHPTSGDPES